MPDLIKCSRCKFRGPQEEFPRRANLEYSKACGPCSQKKANDTAKKRRAKDEENGKQTRQRRTLGKDRSAGGRPSLDWETFIQLLSDNKNDAFELDAIVKLVAFENSKTAAEIANDVAHEVREATGYRFK